MIRHGIRPAGQDSDYFANFVTERTVKPRRHEIRETLYPNVLPAGPLTVDGVRVPDGEGQPGLSRVQDDRAAVARSSQGQRAQRRAASGAEEVSGLLRRSLALHGIRDFLERSAQRIRAGHGRSGRTAAECGHRRVDTGNNARSRGRFRIGSGAAPPGSSHGAISSTRGMSGPSLRAVPASRLSTTTSEKPMPVRRAMPAVLRMAGRRLARYLSRSGAAALFLRYLPQPVQPAAGGALDPGNAGRGAGQERRGRPAAAAMDIVLPAEPRRGSPDCRASRPRGFARHPDGLAACQFSPRTHGRTGLEPDARRAGGRDRTGPGFPAGKRILRRSRPQRHAAQGIRHGPPDPPSEAVRARNSRRGGRIQTPRDRQIPSRPVRGVYVLPGHGSDSALVRDHLRRFGADAVVCGQLFQVAERLAPVLRAIRRLQPRDGTGRNRSLYRSRPCVARYGGGRTLFRMERCGIRRYDLRYGDTRPALLPRREPFVGTHHGRFGRAGTGPRRGRPGFSAPGASCSTGRHGNRHGSADSIRCLRTFRFPTDSPESSA